MKIFSNLFVLCALFLIAGHVFAVSLLANDHRDKHEHSGPGRSGDNNHDIADVGPVSNTTYANECGTCHFAYQPGLLPSESWRKIVGTLPDHFGEELEFNPDSTTEISNYLVTNAAETSSAKLSVKIMKSLGKLTPLRITEIYYVRGKHHEVSAQILERKSVGALSNCTTCHRSAEKGIYDDDSISIPE
jgi:hypothetical protein